MWTQIWQVVVPCLLKVTVVCAVFGGQQQEKVHSFYYFLVSCSCCLSSYSLILVWPGRCWRLQQYWCQPDQGHSRQEMCCPRAGRVRQHSQLWWPGQDAQGSGGRARCGHLHRGTGSLRVVWEQCRKRSVSLPCLSYTYSLIRIT